MKYILILILSFSFLSPALADTDPSSPPKTTSETPGKVTDGSKWACPRISRDDVEVDLEAAEKPGEWKWRLSIKHDDTTHTTVWVTGVTVGKDKDGNEYIINAGEIEDPDGLKYKISKKKFYYKTTNSAGTTIWRTAQGHTSPKQTK